MEAFLPLEDPVGSVDFWLSDFIFVGSGAVVKRSPVATLSNRVEAENKRTFFQRRPYSPFSCFEAHFCRLKIVSAMRKDRAIHASDTRANPANLFRVTGFVPLPPIAMTNSANNKKEHGPSLEDLQALTRGDSDDVQGHGRSSRSHAEIEKRAYQIFLDEGCPEGRSEAHWHQAAAELGRKAGQA